MVRYWIEAGAPYPGTYAAVGSGMIGGYAENKQDQSDRRWPSSIAAVEVIQRRCAHCHNKSLPLPDSRTDVHATRCILSYASGLLWGPFVTDDCEINDLCYLLSFLDSSCIQRIVIDLEMPSTQPVLVMTHFLRTFHRQR